MSTVIWKVGLVRLVKCVSSIVMIWLFSQWFKSLIQMTKRFELKSSSLFIVEKLNNGRIECKI